MKLLTIYQHQFRFGIVVHVGVSRQSVRQSVFCPVHYGDHVLREVMVIQTKVRLQQEGPGPAHDEGAIHAICPLGAGVGVPVVGAGVSGAKAGRE